MFYIIMLAVALYCPEVKLSTCHWVGFQYSTQTIMLECHNKYTGYLEFPAALSDQGGAVVFKKNGCIMRYNESTKKWAPRADWNLCRGEK